MAKLAPEGPFCSPLLVGDLAIRGGGRRFAAFAFATRPAETGAPAFALGFHGVLFAVDVAVRGGLVLRRQGDDVNLGRRASHAADVAHVRAGKIDDSLAVRRPQGVRVAVDAVLGDAFHLAAGPSLDFSPNIGAYLTGGATVTIVRALATSLEAELGLQGRY